MVTSVVSGTQGSYLQLPPTFTLVVNGKELQIETRFLLPCDYFHNMQRSGMRESVQARIELNDFSTESVETFLTFLKTYKLPEFNTQQLIEFFRLVHFFQHAALLDQVRDLLIKEIPTSLKKILQLSDLCSDPQLKLECKEKVIRSPGLYTSLISELIEDSSYDLLKEVQGWPQEVIAPMLTHSNKNDLTPVALLIQKNQFELGLELLKTANRIGVKTAKAFPKAVLLIFGFFASEEEPKDQEKFMNLVTTLSHDDPMILLTVDSEMKSSPVSLAAAQGWSSIFTKMIRLINRNDIATSIVVEDVTLIVLCAVMKRIECIRALKDHPVKQEISVSQFSQALVAAIETTEFSVVNEILSFPIKKGSVNVACIQQAMALKSTDILKAIWPYYNAQPSEIAALRKYAYTENRLDLAEIFFQADFDASKELFPPEVGKITFPWIHRVVFDQKLDWIEFMASRCRDKNVNFEYNYNKTKVQQTPLIYSLKHFKEETSIVRMLELGFDPNVSCGDLHPIHVVFSSKRSSNLIKEIAARVRDVTQLNEKKQGFLHLFFGSGFSFNQLLSLGHQEFTKEKLEKSLFQEDSDKNTPMHLALSNRIPGHSKTAAKDDSLILLTLFLANAPSGFLWKKNGKELTPLIMIQSPSFDEGISSIIDATETVEKLYPEHVKAIQSLQRNLLYWCAQKSLYTLCVRLFPITKDIASVSAKGKNILHLAVEAGVPLAVQKLIEHGVPVDSKDGNGHTALFNSVVAKDVLMVKTLVDLGANTAEPISHALNNFNKPRSADEQEIINILEHKSCTIQ